MAEHSDTASNEEARAQAQKRTLLKARKERLEKAKAAKKDNYNSRERSPKVKVRGKHRSKGDGKIRAKFYDDLSPEDLNKMGIVKVAGFTKADGTKVKAYYYFKKAVKVTPKKWD